MPTGSCFSSQSLLFIVTADTTLVLPTSSKMLLFLFFSLRSIGRRLNALPLSLRIGTLDIILMADDVIACLQYPQHNNLFTARLSGFTSRLKVMVAGF